MKVEVETLYEGCAIDCPKFETNTRFYYNEENIYPKHECVNLRCCKRIAEYLKNNYTVLAENL